MICFHLGTQRSRTLTLNAKRILRAQAALPSTLTDGKVHFQGQGIVYKGRKIKKKKKKK